MASDTENAFLAMTRREFLEHINTGAASFDRVTVGAAVIRRHAADRRRPEILLLQRNLDGARHPGVFEIPGGEIGDEDADASVAAVLSREVLRQSGLGVSRVLHTLPELTYVAEERVPGPGPGPDGRGREEGGGGGEKKVRRTTIQLNYVAEVEDEEELRWNPDEHRAGQWVDEPMLEGLNITEDMKGLVKHALLWAGSFPAPARQPPDPGADADA